MHWQTAEHSLVWRRGRATEDAERHTRLSQVHSVCWQEEAVHAWQDSCSSGRDRCPVSLAARPSRLLRPGKLLSVLCLLGASQWEPAQAIGNCPVPWTVTDGTGPCHCWPKNMTTCCETSADQAVQACLEYAQLGFTERACASWPRAVRVACHRYCGDRYEIATAVKEICQFSLQVLNDGPLTVKYCKQTYDQFLNYRWLVGCAFNETNCTGVQGNPEGDTCMSECGNYAKCNCRVRRGTLLPDKCDGQTILKGSMPNRSIGNPRNWSCADTPPHCQSQIEEGAKCNKYRLCKTDMCLLKKVSCPPLDQCTKPGFCEKTEGLCFYKNIDDGTPCDDGIQHTVRDQCFNGRCYGENDNCVRYNVTCPSYSQCISGGVCHPHSGSCSYTHAMNGYPCDDGREFTVEDGCVNGFCLGRAVDLCLEQGMNCSDQLPNTCHAPGECDPQTGQCSLPVPLSNKVCDDSDPTTVQDTCIDGLCVGYARRDWYDQRFETLGPGQCADRSGRQTPSYSGDIASEPECEDLCKADRQCSAFSYAPPCCSLYGSIRTRPPVESRRPWSWQGGSLPVAVRVEVAVTVKGQRESVCRKKDEYGDQVLPQASGKVEIDTVFSFNVMLVFFVLIMLTFCFLPIWKCWRLFCCGRNARKFCCCGPRKPPDVLETKVVECSPRSSDVGQSPDIDNSGDSEDDQDHLRKVAQAPMEALPDSPAPPVEMVPYGESLTPSQALSPLTLQASGSLRSNPGLPAGRTMSEQLNCPVISPEPSVSSTASPSSRNKKWSRPVGRRKPTAEERAPPPTENERIMQGSSKGAAVGRNLFYTLG